MNYVINDPKLPTNFLADTYDELRSSLLSHQTLSQDQVEPLMNIEDTPLVISKLYVFGLENECN